MAGNRKLSSTVHLFLRSYREKILFVPRFAVIFLSLNFVYFLIADTWIQDFIFASLTARPAAAVIQFISSGDEVIAGGSVLLSQFASLQIVHGCEGAQSILILTSAILAYATGRMHKLIGLLAGVSLLYLANLLRIVGVYFVVKYNRSALDVAHFYVGQTLIIFIMFAFFILWVRKDVDGQ